jgi:hypothetical protein
MFAVGPPLDLNSDALDAGIRRHAAYGQCELPPLSLPSTLERNKQTS